MNATPEALIRDAVALVSTALAQVEPREELSGHLSEAHCSLEKALHYAEMLPTTKEDP